MKKTPCSAAKAPSARRAGRPRAFDRTEALETALKLFWSYGYEPVSVACLCSEMGIKPPSFYAAFESKESLFIEATLYYEKKYWSEPLARFEHASDPISKALGDFFQEAAGILLSPQNPSGCMAVLAAMNISPDASRISELVNKIRRETKLFFKRRLDLAQQQGELKPDADTSSLADAFNIFLEGMSVQAKDGMSLERLQQAASMAPLILLPWLVRK